MLNQKDKARVVDGLTSPSIYPRYHLYFSCQFSAYLVRIESDWTEIEPANVQRKESESEGASFVNLV